MNLSKRSYELELLDKDDIPAADIRLNMQELEVINRWLGGHTITLRGFKKLLGKRKQIHVAEIGCGGGDNLMAIYNWCKANNVQVSITGIDIKYACIEVAMQQPMAAGTATWICSDYRAAIFQTPPDILFSSLFCHHFSEAAIQQQLTWMHEQAIIGFFINDLHRHVVARSAIKMLTQLFSKSYLVRHDAPLSVARGFTLAEWRNMLAAAGLPQAKVRWQWAFRHLITCMKLGSNAI